MTLGLKGIWVLARLDRTDIDSWKLGVMLFSIGLFLEQINAHPVSMVFFCLLIPVYGVVVGVLMDTFYVQSKSLSHAAGVIEIDLYRLAGYSTIAGPAVRPSG